MTRSFGVTHSVERESKCLENHVPKTLHIMYLYVKECQSIHFHWLDHSFLMNMYSYTWLLSALRDDSFVVYSDDVVGGGAIFSPIRSRSGCHVPILLSWFMGRRTIVVGGKTIILFWWTLTYLLCWIKAGKMGLVLWAVKGYYSSDDKPAAHVALRLFLF